MRFRDRASYSVISNRSFVVGVILASIVAIPWGCVGNQPRVADINQDFSDISQRFETYQQNQEAARLRQQKALLQIREMIDSESQEIAKPPEVFASQRSLESAPISASPGAVSTTYAPSRETDRPEVKTLFQNALTKYNQKQYISAAEDFLLAYSKSVDDSMKARCLFWTGECHYQSRQWDRALQCFLQIESRYPSHPLVPSALLKRGYTYINSGKLSDGKSVLKELVARYPHSSEAALAGERLRELGIQ